MRHEPPPSKRARSPKEEEVFDIDQSPPKRRRGPGKIKGTKRSREIEQLLRPVDEEDREEGDEELRCSSVKPDQIRFYTGEARAVVEDARDSMRFYLFTNNPFASIPDLTERGKVFFVAACQDRYRSKYKVNGGCSRKLING